jgi:chemotaxis protein methyltransferase CheR
MGTWSEPEYETVARMVNEQTGLVFRKSSCNAVEAGTRRAMERAGVGEVTRYLDLLRGRDVILNDLIDELTVRETYFFRQPDRFEFIRRHVLPEIRRRRGTDHVVRAWSAGCASGEEAYSLAIVFDQEGLAERSSILATDISGIALQVAAEAAYGVSSLRGMSEELVRRYFHRRGYREVLDERIRRRVTFRQSNLATTDRVEVSDQAHEMDLILCRNVLIYFDRVSVGRVARRLFDSLAEGGWLVAGASDPPLAADAPFETVLTDQGVLYRRGRGSTTAKQGLSVMHRRRVWRSSVAGAVALAG